MADERQLIDLKGNYRLDAEDYTGSTIIFNNGNITVVNEDGCYICEFDARKLPVVTADDLKEFAKDVAYQFGYYCQNKGRLCITHGGLSTLERAFDILGWENPHPVPECECEFDGCHEHATCGTPTKDGYKRVCGKHFTELQKES